jgi:putative membrane protein
MKKSLRFASAALAVALAASCAAPAFAAGSSSFTKSETVYAVMNDDGSISSTTVSEHVYSASGLSNVTDKSSLTNIQNTESDAAFTQNGEDITWNTDDTDVYYKGDTDRSLPISAKITYAMDGQEAALEDLIGKSGHLTVTIALTNSETDTITVNGAERTIVTPLITAVGVIFGEDASNVTAEHGIIESAAKSSVAAFVTLPGVKDSLSGLLPDEVDSIEDYLQDTITVEADVTELTCPQVMMACATSTAALGTDNVFDLSSINDLTDGINQLNDAMSQLLDGASQLEDGTTQLASGVLALLDGANTLNNGAAALDEGLGQLTNGLDTLSANNSALNSGAQQVADGVLASANKTLKEGGLIDEDMTWSNYASVIDNILTINDKTLAAGRRKMVRTIWEQAPSFKDSQLDLALYLSATKTNHDLEAALHLMQNYDPSMLCGLVQLLTSQEAKDTAKAELKYQVENSQDIADVRALKDSLSKIQLFVSSVGQYTAGVQTAADGAHSAKDGSAQLAAGTQTLYDGVNTLNTGASQLNDGAGQLNDGLNQFNEEGISKLTGALDEDQLHGLKTVLDEMTDRLENYTSFAGAPDDAENSVKFIYKTAETVAAADATAAETETVQEGNFFTRLWQRIVNLFKF